MKSRFVATHCREWLERIADQHAITIERTGVMITPWMVSGVNRSNRERWFRSVISTRSYKLNRLHVGH